MFNDLRHAIRMLFKNPGFATVAVLTLAFGIGATTAIFSVVNAILLRPLPYKDTDNVVIVWEKRQIEGTKTNGVTPADYLDWQAQNRVFASLTAHDQMPFTLTDGGEPERLTGTLVSINMLETYGIQPILGRGFLPSDQEGAGRVALLSYGLWQQRFGGDRKVLQRSIWLNNQPHSVIGVLPPDFRMYVGQQTDLYLPFIMGPAEKQNRGGHTLWVVGRLRPGVTLEQAQAEMDLISRAIERQWPTFNKGHGAHLVPIRQQLTELIRPILLILMGAVVFVLLIACANVANLLLARGVTRQREIAVRQALGASRGQLVQLLLTESIVLSLMGGMIGVLLAQGGLTLIQSLLPRILGVAWIPGIDQISIDVRVLLFTGLASMLSGIVFGLAPALHLARTDMPSALKVSGRSSSASLGHRRFRSLLVVSETALACVLLIGATLLITSFVRLMRVNPGFQSHHRLGIEIPTPPEYAQPGRQHVLYAGLLERVSALPSVKSAALTNYVPGFTFGWRWGLRLEGQPQAPSIEETLKIHMRLVSEGFLSTMGIPLLQGRNLSVQDSDRSLPIVLISQTTARRYFPGQDAIDRRIALGDQPIWRTIVGVTGDVKHLGLNKDPEPEIYLPLAQFPNPFPQIWLVVQTSADPALLASAVRHEIGSLDHNLAVAEVETIDQLLDESTSSQRFNAVLIGAFSGVAFLLAIAGLYSVMAYLVTQRTQEIGIRMALGAQPRDISWLVLREGMLLALVGLAIGLVAALGLTRILSTLLFGVSPTDLPTFVAVSLVLATVALLACYIPARRATKVDPMVALRYE
jgi:putative ABC transport system permease protein